MVFCLVRRATVPIDTLDVGTGVKLSLDSGLEK